MVQNTRLNIEFWNLFKSRISSDYLSFSHNFTKSGMDGGESGCDLDGGEGQAMILTVLDRYHPGRNYRIAKEILHNRDRGWMSEYILKS